MLEFSGFLGYPEAKYVLVDLTIEGVYFGHAILTRGVWEKLKLLERPKMHLPDSVIKVTEKGNSEQGISPVGEVQEYDPGSPERGSGRLQALPLSATEKSSEQPGNGDGIAEKA
jgi:hypothetical protein